MATPYKDRALAHYDKGWQVFPCTPRAKEPLVKGRSGGYQSEPVDRDTIERETTRFDKANIGIRIPDDMIGLDVDLDPDRGRDGSPSFEALDLPPTVGLSHGSFHYRHHLYRVPDEVTKDDIARLRDERGGIDLLRWMHRLTVGAGSLHKSGEAYFWIRKDGTRSNGIPRPDQCTALTLEEWEHIVEFFGERSQIDTYVAENVDMDEWLAAHGGDPSDAMKAAFRAWSRRSPDAQRHSAAGLAAYRMAQEAEDGEPGAQKGFWRLRHEFIEAVSDRSSEQEAEDEFERLAVSAIGKALAKTEAEGRGPAVIEDLKIEHREEPELGKGRRADDAYHSAINAEGVDFAREYLSRHHMADGVPSLKTVGKTFFRWNDTRWVETEDEMVSRWIMDDLRGAYEPDTEGNEVKPIRLKMKNVNEVRAALVSLVADKPQPATGGVPFKDGWLDVVTGEVSPLSPERWHTWCVPASYENHSGCPEWLKFLRSIGWGEDTEEHRALKQFFGYTLSGDNDQQKILLLHGPSRSGKGTILKIARAMMGDGATGMQLATLAQTFGLQSLLGKPLALIGDARFTAKVDKAIVERLLTISGDDEVLVEVKFKGAVTTRLPTRFILATNERPVFTESSDALAKRFLILHMGKSFFGQEDFGLEQRLLREIPGIVDWALEGYKDLRASGWLLQPEVGRQMQEDFIKDSAPLRHFVDEECELAIPEGAFFSKDVQTQSVEAYKVRNDDLYARYRSWCERGGHHPLNNVHFMRELLTAYEGQIVDGKSHGTRVKKGVRLREGR